MYGPILLRGGDSHNTQPRLWGLNKVQNKKERKGKGGKKKRKEEKRKKVEGKSKKVK